MGQAGAAALLEARCQGGRLVSLADAMERTGLPREVVLNLVTAGAFDTLAASFTNGRTQSFGGKMADRRAARWEFGCATAPPVFCKPCACRWSRTWPDCPARASGR